MRTLTLDTFVEHVRAKLAAKPHKPSYHHYQLAPDRVKPAAFALIVGAGLSHPVVPLVRKLMCETIGDYFIPDQDQSSMERPRTVLLEHSADFWSRLNEAAVANGLPEVVMDRSGLPEDPGSAYQYLFTYHGANALFALEEDSERKLRKPSFLERLLQSRASQSANTPSLEPQDSGERFLQGFLRYVMDIGCERGYGSSGRSYLNEAHIYLAALLEAQQTGIGWNSRAFCRTIFTTNFDTLLQNALQMVDLLYSITDRPEMGLDSSEFTQEETVIHLVYTHGSILRHNPASTVVELDQLAQQNVDVLHDYLESRDIITVGYSGWNDSLMAALRLCRPDAHEVYCCDILQNPPARIAEFLAGCADHGAYVHCGADDIFRSLYQVLVSEDARPDPMWRYLERNDRLWNR
jgi:hypothetical protein